MAKLGTDTGSLVNYLCMNSSNSIVPEVGMGVTFYGWSDRDPGTIQSIEVIKDRVYLGITGDDYQRIDTNGFSESQTYEYTSRPDRHKVFYRQTKDKKGWESTKLSDKGRWVKGGGRAMSIGHREKYYDFSF